MNKGKPNYSQNNLPKCPFVHYKPSVAWPGTEHRPPQWEASD